MKDSTFQANKQASITRRPRLRCPSKASLHALYSVHLFTHCSTMLGYIVYSLYGYMHTGRSRTRGKTTNKRLLLAEETSSLDQYTASQEEKSKEVA